MDKELKVSPQLDVIISDSSACPVLFEGEKGTKFYPYESVYAFAEVKTSYIHSKRFIQNFGTTRQRIQSELIREETSPNHFGNGISVGPGLSIAGVKGPYRNPLFSFILFVESGDISHKKLLSEYATSTDEYLPNIACFLDGAIICKSGLSLGTNELRVDSIVTNSHEIKSDKSLYWLKINFKDASLRGGHALAHLMLALFDHLNSCVLSRPPIHDYMKQMIKAADYGGELLDLRIVEKAGLKLPPNWQESAEDIIGRLDVDE